MKTGRLRGLVLPVMLIMAAVLFLPPHPVSAQTVIGQEPALIRAVIAGDLKEASAELVRGAHPDTPDFKGRTGVIIAAGNGDLAMLELLHDNGARLDRQDEFGNTALFQASERGEAAIVDRLLMLGADGNRANGQGMTPVMAAAKAGFMEVVKRLIAAGVDLSLTDYTGRGVLDYARDGRQPSLPKLLEDAGAR